MVGQSGAELPPSPVQPHSDGAGLKSQDLSGVRDAEAVHHRQLEHRTELRVQELQLLDQCASVARGVDAFKRCTAWTCSR